MTSEVTSVHIAGLSPINYNFHKCWGHSYTSGVKFWALFVATNYPLNLDNLE